MIGVQIEYNANWSPVCYVTPFKHTLFNHITNHKVDLIFGGVESFVVCMGIVKPALPSGVDRAVNNIMLH